MKPSLFIFVSVVTCISLQGCTHLAGSVQGRNFAASGGYYGGYPYAGGAWPMIAAENQRRYEESRRHYPQATSGATQDSAGSFESGGFAGEAFVCPQYLVIDRQDGSVHRFDPGPGWDGLQEASCDFSNKRLATDSAGHRIEGAFCTLKNGTWIIKIDPASCQQVAPRQR